MITGTLSSGQLQWHQLRQQQRKLSKTQRDIHQRSTKINISVICDHSGSEWEESDSIGGVATTGKMQWAEFRSEREWSEVCICSLRSSLVGGA